MSMMYSYKFYYHILSKVPKQHCGHDGGETNGLPLSLALLQMSSMIDMSCHILLPWLLATLYFTPLFAGIEQSEDRCPRISHQKKNTLTFLYKNFNQSGSSDEPGDPKN